MPTIELTDQELQIVINVLAMDNPLIRKIMEQNNRQQQEIRNERNSDAQRRAAEHGGSQGKASLADFGPDNGARPAADTNERPAVPQTGTPRSALNP